MVHWHQIQSIPEITNLEVILFSMMQKKIGTSTNYLSMYLTDLHQTFRICSYVRGDDLQAVALRSLMGHCYSSH